MDTYTLIYGSAQIGAVILSIIAGGLALSLIAPSQRERMLQAWPALLLALVLFVVEELLGATRTFGFHDNAWITHVVPSAILLMLIWSLIIQTNIAKGWLE